MTMLVDDMVVGIILSFTFTVIYGIIPVGRARFTVILYGKDHQQPLSKVWAHAAERLLLRPD